ncbi:uncharacterized protein LOC134190189 [Corticium candelabrum]|uniref:uncharacterized protein LOC134190189 n=1 Tax=Corticium candelabrum TaxID=121492 RepID=UPI002E2665E4|nr:uncharacterized protein LOC134190189 [Corticium candelabrum]
MEFVCERRETEGSSCSECDDANSDAEVHGHDHQLTSYHQTSQSTVDTAHPVTCRLKHWQTEINQNVKGSYYLVGKALYQILYVEKLLNSTSFVPWVKETFGLTRSTAYEYVRAYRVVELLQKVDPSLPVPSTLSHFRVFNKCKLDSVEVPRVWRRVLKSVPSNCQRLTAKMVIASRKGMAPVEERRKASCIHSVDSTGHCFTATGFSTSDDDDDSNGAPAAKRKKSVSSDGLCSPSDEINPNNIPKYLTMEMLTGMVKECQNPLVCSTTSVSPREDKWQEVVFANLVALFPDDVGFKDQGAFMENILYRFEQGMMKRGIFVVQMAFHSPSFVSLLGYPHCYLKPLAVVDTGNGSDGSSLPMSLCPGACNLKGFVLKQCVAIYIGKYAEKFVQVFSRCGVIPGVNSWSL